MNTKKNMKERFGKLNHYLNTKATNMSRIHKVLMVAESLFGRVFLGVTVEDYFQYHFYEKNWYGRGLYYTYGKRQKLTKKCNSLAGATLFTDKALFAKRFKDYTGRAILDMRTVSKEEFMEVASRNISLFVKPVDGSWGLGTSIENVMGGKAIALFEKLKGQAVLVEEYIEQCEDLAKFNSTSTNSLRVVTFVNSTGEPVLMSGTVLRVGRQGKVADNFHHQGIAAFVDNTTGIVCTRGVDKEGNHYVVHPDSKVPIVGFKIPMWDQIKEKVLLAAHVCPEVKYVGWDVTVTKDNKVVFIEGNDKADPDVAQMSLGEGLWAEYRDMM